MARHVTLAEPGGGDEGAAATACLGACLRSCWCFGGATFAFLSFRADPRRAGAGEASVTLSAGGRHTSMFACPLNHAPAGLRGALFVRPANLMAVRLSDARDARVRWRPLDLIEARLLTTAVLGALAAYELPLGGGGADSGAGDVAVLEGYGAIHCAVLAAAPLAGAVGRQVERWLTGFVGTVHVMDELTLDTKHFLGYGGGVRTRLNLYC